MALIDRTTLGRPCLSTNADRLYHSGIVVGETTRLGLAGTAPSPLPALEKDLPSELGW